MSPERFKTVVDLIKEIPGRKYQEGSWSIPISELSRLLDLFGKSIHWVTPYEEVLAANKAKQTELITTAEAMDFGGLKLKPYPFQIVGSAFLLHIKKGILADEMGLGKSCQAIAAVHSLMKQGRVRKALVICPASLKYQWEDEIQKFTDHTTVVVDGDPGDREELYNSDATFTVINYELARQDWDLEQLKKLAPDVIILDEAHRIKNWEAKTSKQLKELNADYKWLLTGTPMQNKPDELFNLFSFLDPEILGNWFAFRHRYIVLGTKFGRKNMIVGYKNLSDLRARIAPYMIRRLKVEVAPELPNIVVSNYLVPMSPAQQELHEEIRLQIRDLLDRMRDWKGEGEDPREGQLLGMFSMLTEVCDSPELLTMSESKMAAKFKVTSTKSPKLDELLLILGSALAENPDFKAVIFTQFERMQRLIVQKLNKVGKTVILNGSMRPYERQVAIDQFKHDKDTHFFVSTDAGNYGLNLAEASMVVNFDLPWNPAVWAQRGGRIHRLDSTFDKVYVVNLVAQGGIDERILKVLYSKMELTNQLIEKTESEKAAISKLTSGILDRLTRKTKKRREGA